MEFSGPSAGGVRSGRTREILPACPSVGFPVKAARVYGLRLRRNGGRCRSPAGSRASGPILRRTIRGFASSGNPMRGADKRSRRLCIIGEKSYLCVRIFGRSARRMSCSGTFADGRSGFPDGKFPPFPLPKTRTHSSVGQSSGLIIRRSWDHAPLGPLSKKTSRCESRRFLFGECVRRSDR